MPQYLGPAHAHGQPQRIGVLLANLGTPDAPEPAAVRRFLAEFLSDPRVVEAPRWLWWLALHGFILRVRPRRSAHAYRQIWTEQGSPLMVYSRALATKLAATLRERLGPNATLALGMTYGNPSLDAALDELRSQNVDRLLVLPLYPQYSGTTTAAVFDRVSRHLQRWRLLPALRFITHYYDEPAYIDALANSIERHWAQQGRKHLLFSFHGLPQSYVAAGDPYRDQSLTTAQLVSERLQLAQDQWSISFQSQVGRAEWLRPYTDETLLRYAREGIRDITVACPGFATDCLETLEEIALRNREAFLRAGGHSYDYVPALNDDDAHVALLGDLLVRHARGWPSSTHDPNETALTASRVRRAGA